ncbi:hypothetical protein [Arthrobacter sp. U41]|uniref:hypothetical protein n=1 Tax=Arthrobacter sp. U41 TaxID=1849032 RepID=UPI003FA455E0
MFTTTQGLAGSESECAGAAAEGAGGTVSGAGAAGLSGAGSMDGVPPAVADGIALRAADTDGEAEADDVGRAASGTQALRAASPDPASSRRLNARLLEVPAAESGTPGDTADAS